MSQQELEHYLAMFTLTMPLVITAAHGFRALALRLHAHAKSTADKHDDKVTQRILNVATWLDICATFVATASSGGLNRTPSLERAEGEDGQG